MSFIIQDEAQDPVDLHEWACVAFNVPGVQSVRFVPSVTTSYLHTGRFFGIESVYVADPQNPGYMMRNFFERRIRAHLGGGYLTWEQNANTVYNNDYIGCNGTANNTNEVWKLLINHAWKNEFRLSFNPKILTSSDCVAPTKDSATSFRFSLVSYLDQQCRLLITPRILDTPFKYVLRCNNGRYWSLQKNSPSYPYVQLSVNMDTYETFQFVPIKYPNVYAIYCPYWNCYLAEDTHTNGPTTLGYRENAQNSYDPAYFPEAQFRIHYIPELTTPLQVPRLDAFGKFIFQSVVRPNTFVATDSYRSIMPTPGPQTSWPYPGPPYPGNYPMLANAKPNGDIDSPDKDFYHIELVPAQWTNTNNLQAFPALSLDRAPNN